MWVLLPLLLYSSLFSISGSQRLATELTTTRSYDLPQEAWVVVGVIVFGVVFILSVTWVLFTCAICKSNSEYRKFKKSLKRHRLRRVQNQQRRWQPNRPSADRQTPAQAPPVAISYRRDLRTPAEVYVTVSLAQLTAMMNGGQQISLQGRGGRLGRSAEAEPPGLEPSAPPFPDSPPDYYEYMSQNNYQTQPENFQETQFIHQSEEEA